MIKTANHHQHAPMPHDDDHCAMQSRRPRLTRPSSEQKHKQQQEEETTNPDMMIVKKGMIGSDEEVSSTQKNKQKLNQEEEEEEEKQEEQQHKEQIEIFIPANTSFLEKGTELPPCDFLVGIPRVFENHGSRGSGDLGTPVTAAAGSGSGVRNSSSAAAATGTGNSRNRRKKKNTTWTQKHKEMIVVADESPVVKAAAADVRTVAMTESTVEKTDTIPSLIYAYHGEDEVSCICDDPIFVAEKKMMSRRTQRHFETLRSPRMDDDSPSRIRQYFESVHLHRQQQPPPPPPTATTTRLTTTDDDEKRDFETSLRTSSPSRIRQYFESVHAQRQPQQQQQQEQPSAYTASTTRSTMDDDEKYARSLQRHFESLLLQEDEQQRQQQPTTTAAAARSGMVNEMELQRHFESLLLQEEKQQQGPTTTRNGMVTRMNEMEMNNNESCFQQHLQELCHIYDERENRLLLFDDKSLPGFSPSEILQDFSLTDE